MTSPDITVIGSGLSGTLMALYLAQEGLSVQLYEKRPDMRNSEQFAGRSINLALSVRGLYALKEVGLEDKVLEQCLPMRGRLMHTQGGPANATTHLNYQAYGLFEHEYINSISRPYLNTVLMNAAEDAGVKIQFNQRCEGIDLNTGQTQFTDLNQNITYTLTDTPVIGADGVGSALRRSLIQRLRVNYAQDYLEHGYKELSIGPGPDGDFQLDSGALHIWPRGSFMLIALPNPDKTFTCTLFLPFDGQPGFEQLQSKDELETFFKQEFPDALALMPHLAQEFFANSTGVLSTIHCGPWFVENKLLLIGDAAHAIVPFFGQGMNASFEDCTLFMQSFRQHGPDWQEVFTQFYQSRKADADAIAQLALDNFIEMRDSVADAAFLLRKAVSLKLEERYPNVFIPKYSLVSFHRVPYAEALRQGKLQQVLLEELCAGIQSPKALDWLKADALIENYRKVISKRAFG